MIVLKVGGASTGGVAQAVASFDEPVCVVHGAGPQITEEMERRGLVPEFVDGRRVTTTDVMEVVRKSFAEINRAICAAIGADAVGLFGDEIGLAADHAPELGLVGRAKPSAPRTVLAAARAARSGLIAEIGVTAVTA